MTQVFLSHSTKDAEFAQRIADDLRAAGVPVWKAPESIRPGEGWVRAMEYGLTTSTHMLLLMSPAAVSSEWVNWEVDLAVILHARGQIEILPLDYKPCDPPLRWQPFHALSGIANDYDATVLDLLQQFRTRSPDRPPAPADSTVTTQIVGQDILGIPRRESGYAARPKAPPPIHLMREASRENPAKRYIDAAATYRDAVKAYQDDDFEIALHLANILQQAVPEFLPEQVEALATDAEEVVEAETRRKEYGREYQQVVLLAQQDFTFEAARQLWTRLRGDYPEIEHDPENLSARLLYQIDEILPSPFEWIEIPAGQVMLISEENWRENYIPNGKNKTFSVGRFLLAKYPVTNAQFQAFVEAIDGYRIARWWNYSDQAKRWRSRHNQPSDPEWDGPPDHPRVNVSWFEAVAFCRWLSSTTGIEVRLPSEREWQRAARGDDGRTYPWGNQVPDTELANFDKKVGQTTPVESYPGGASPYGVLDMAGNVWEWCATDSQTGYAGIERDLKKCVLRGGSWLDNANHVRTAFRYWLSPNDKGNLFGFRLAQSSPP